MFTASASFYSESTEKRISLMLGEGFRARLVGESFRIVDVGCGFGSMALWFAANFPNAEVVGIDPDAEFLSVGRTVAQVSGLTNVQFVESDILGIDGLGVFDLVVCSNVLNFLNNSKDLRLGVEKLCKLTGEGGILAIWSPFRGLREAFSKIPLADFAPFWLRRLLVRVFKVDSHLSNTRSPGFSEVRKILEENGLDAELPLKRLGWRKVLRIHRNLVAARNLGQ